MLCQLLHESSSCSSKLTMQQLLSQEHNHMVTWSLRSYAMHCKYLIPAIAPQLSANQWIASTTRYCAPTAACYARFVHQ